MLKKEISVSCEKRRKIRTSEKERREENLYIHKNNKSVYTLFDSYRDNRKSSLKKKVENAKKLVEKFSKYNITMLFSGGKDSLVTLDICNNFIDEILYIEIPGNTHNLCTKYVEKISDEYGKPLKIIKHTEDFFNVMFRRGYPSSFFNSGSRWCMKIFKANVLKKKTKIVCSLTGVKASDSNRRASFFQKYVINGVRREKDKHREWGVFQLFPIWNFSRQDVFDYIEENSLELNPCYEMFENSGNCLICPFYGIKHLMRLKRYDKETYSRWKSVHEHLRKKFDEGDSYGYRITFYRFDSFYEKLELQRRLL